MTLLSLFESFCQRGALQKAAAICEEAIAATSETGSACNEHIRRAWEDLLAVVRVRQLSATELAKARQLLVRYWNVPPKRGAQALPREIHFELPASLADPVPPIPAPEPTTLSETDFRSARETYDRQLVAAALERSGGRIKEASRLLGLSRNGLKGKMRRYGLM